MINSAAMSANAAVMSMFIMLCVVLMGGMVSCSGIEDEPSTVKPCENCNKPDQPDVTVKEVHHDGCKVLDLTWREENAVITKASADDYSVDASDGGLFASVRMQYNANVEYSDGSFVPQYPTYNINNATVGFGFKNTVVVKKGAIASFKNDPTVSSQNGINGKVTFLKYGETYTLAFLANSTKSVNSLTIAGETKTDLCENGISYKYSNTEIIADGDSIDKYDMYNVRIHGTSTVAEGNNNTKNFYVTLRIAELKDGSIIPPVTDPELVGYDVINQAVNGNKFTGDLVEIWSDGSNKNVGKISFTYNSKDITPNNIERKVAELTYAKLDPTYGNNVRTGENRTLNQLGCTINLTELKNTVSMNTNRGSLVFGRTFEWAVLTAPNGDQIELKGMDAAIKAGSVSDGGVQGNSMVITMTATGNSSMSATLTLTKNGNDPQPGDKVQTGAYAKNQHIEGIWIKWTLVRTFSNNSEEEIPLSVAHKYNLSTESRKATQNRTYSATQGSMNLVSSENFSDDNYAGTFKKYTRNFSYVDFNNTISAEGRDYITYNDNGFELEVWNVSLSIEKQGQTLGTSNISTDANWTKYIDNINYSLFAGSASAADGSQEVEYSKKNEDPNPGDEDKVTYSVEKDRVEGNKLYYYEVENHTVNTAENKKVEKSTLLVFSLHATACNDWTANEGETGMSLTNSSATYDSAKDYIFGSNRGNNIAKTSLQTSYNVEYHGTHTLTISGEVKGSVAKTASTSTSNTYAFTAKLFAEGVEIASDSDTAVETVKKAQEDVVTREVQKTGISNGNINYDYIVKHSVNTDQNTTTSHSIPVAASVTAQAVADWTAKEGETGMSLTNPVQSYSNAGNYVFGSNRGDNIANASLQTTYTVTHDGQNFTLTVNGTVEGSVAANNNTYTFTAVVKADGVEVAKASDIAIETVKVVPNLGIVAVYSTISCSATGLSETVYVATYTNGNAIAKSTNGSEICRGANPGLTPTVLAGALASVSQTGNVWNYIGTAGTAHFPLQDFTYTATGSPILNCAVSVNEDGTWTATNGTSTVTFGAY